MTSYLRHVRSGRRMYNTYNCFVSSINPSDVRGFRFFSREPVSDEYTSTCSVNTVGELDIRHSKKNYMFN
jgi:hypothetical protein